MTNPKSLLRNIHHQGEPFFIAGLLHGIGKLIFYSQDPDRYREMLERAGPDRQARISAERQIFGFTYADLRAELLKSWRLLEELHLAITYHLEANKSSDHRREATILHVAVKLADAKQLRVETASSTPPPELNPDQVAALAKSLNLLLDTLTALPSEIDVQAKEIFKAIRPSATFVS